MNEDIKNFVNFVLDENPRALYIPLIQYETGLTEEEASILYDEYMNNDGLRILSDEFYKDN